MTASGEFDRIARWLAPLTNSEPGAANLEDDAAHLSVPPDKVLVTTTDTMVEGVHFLGREAPGDIARKLLRVNLSDLAAKGAAPTAYMLNLALNETQDDAWFEGFTDGLAEDQAKYGLYLLGGDSVRTKGPMVLTLTAFGFVPMGGMLRRMDARVGDVIFMTGTVGDAALGLKVITGGMLGLEPTISQALEDAYLLPNPPVEFGAGLAALSPRQVGAAMDISDGLLGDLQHICRASGVGARLVSNLLPLSDAAAAVVAEDMTQLVTLVTGGDDYQILLTARPEAGESLMQLAQAGGTKLTRIGEIVAGSDVELVDEEGESLGLEPRGYVHF